MVYAGTPEEPGKGGESLRRVPTDICEEYNCVTKQAQGGKDFVRSCLTEA